MKSKERVKPISSVVFALGGTPHVHYQGFSIENIEDAFNRALRTSSHR